MKYLILILTTILSLNCGYGNKEYLQENGPAYLESQGFEIVTSEGFQIGLVVPFTEYGGAAVWYIVKRKDDPKTLYNLYLKRWGNEIHIYSIFALNAISNNK